MHSWTYAGALCRSHLQHLTRCILLSCLRWLVLKDGKPSVLQKSSNGGNLLLSRCHPEFYSCSSLQRWAGFTDTICAWQVSTTAGRMPWNSYQLASRTLTSMHLKGWQCHLPLIRSNLDGQRRQQIRPSNLQKLCQTRADIRRSQVRTFLRNPSVPRLPPYDVPRNPPARLGSPRPSAALQSWRQSL